MNSGVAAGGVSPFSWSIDLAAAIRIWYNEAPGMELRHLRAFTTVAELRSFSKAARRLHLSQPPLSRHIRQLEEEVGVTLFLRSTTGVELTAEGKVLLEKARAVLVDANDFLELAGRAKEGSATALKVGMARGLCEIVNRVRLHLASQHIDVSFEGTDMLSSSQYDALRQKTIDVGVLRHVNDVPGIECQPLFEERFVVAIAEDNPLAKMKSLTLRQVAAEPIFLHERSFAPFPHDKILALYTAAGITPNVVTVNAEPGQQASMLAVASGKGICLSLRSAYSKSYTPVKDVAIVPLDDPDATLDVHVAWRRGETSHAVHRFVQAARETYPFARAVRHLRHA